MKVKKVDELKCQIHQHINKNSTEANSAVAKLKGQVALELLIITSFLLIILIPTFIYIISVLSTESWKTDSQQAYATASKIASISSQLAMLGNGSKTSESFYLPSSAISMNVTSDGRELFITLNTGKAGKMDVVVLSDVQLQLNPAKDWKNIRGAFTLYFTVQDGKVLISKEY